MYVTVLYSLKCLGPFFFGNVIHSHSIDLGLRSWAGQLGWAAVGCLALPKIENALSQIEILSSELANKYQKNEGLIFEL